MPSPSKELKGEGDSPVSKVQLPVPDSNVWLPSLAAPKFSPTITMPAKEPPSSLPRARHLQAGTLQRSPRDLFSIETLPIPEAPNPRLFHDTAPTSTIPRLPSITDKTSPRARATAFLKSHAPGPPSPGAGQQKGSPRQLQQRLSPEAGTPTGAGNRRETQTVYTEEEQQDMVPGVVTGGEGSTRGVARAKRPWRSPRSSLD